MAKQPPKNDDKFKEDLKRVSSLIASLTVVFTAGYFIGEWRTESRMQARIHELEFQSLQLKVEYTEKLYIERQNKSADIPHVSDEDLAEFVKTLNDYVQQNTHEKK